MRGNKGMKANVIRMTGLGVAAAMAGLGLLPVVGLATQAAAAETAERQLSMAMSLAGISENLARSASLADRHILFGFTLLAFSLMATLTFSLWRWQMSGLAAEARYSGQ